MTEDLESASRPDAARDRGELDLVPLLRREVRGLEILDQGFVIARGDVEQRADWIGVDRAGRLVVVVLVEGGDDVVLLTTLTALASASEIRHPAARRWPEARIRTEIEPLVVLIARTYSPRVASALSFLPGDAVLALELRALETARTAEAYLVRRDVSVRAASAASPHDVLATWPEAVRERAGHLATRLARIDPELDCCAQNGALRWSWHDEDVAELGCSEGLLRVEALGSRVSLRPDDEAGIESWFERALIAHCARRRRVGALDRDTARGVRPLDVLGRGSAPLLTPEELAAFRD